MPLDGGASGGRRCHSEVAALGLLVGEQLCETLDVRAGQKVLDVAAGNGNVTLAAARRWCDVIATDYVPALLERARERAEAYGAAFMGLTVGCAVCHDHKYDPTTQKDFYQLSAFFNNIDEEPFNGDKPN